MALVMLAFHLAPITIQYCMSRGMAESASTEAIENVPRQFMEGCPQEFIIAAVVSLGWPERVPVVFFSPLCPWVLW